MPNRSLIALTAAVGALAAAPAASHADIYCVNTTGCPFGTVQPSVQAALDASEADGNNADTVFIGAKATPYVGPFEYNEGGGGGRLSLIGSGIGQTILSSNGAGGHTLSLDHPDSEVRDLTLRTATTGPFSALWLNGGRADGVRIQQIGSEFSTSGVKFHGAGSEFVDGEIDMTQGVGVAAENPNPVNGLRVDRSVLTGRSGVDVKSGNALTVDRSVLDTTRTVATSSGASSDLTITNSVLRMTPTANDSALVAFGTSTLTAVHLTLLGSGTSYAVTANGSSAAATATATVRNSIISGFQHVGGCSATDAASDVKVVIQYSAINGAPGVTTPGCTYTAGAGVQTLTPQFAGGAPGADLAAADLRLRAPSTLIDAGDGGGVLATDFAGLSRPVDGDGAGGAKVDLGALEYRRIAPVPALAAPASATTGDPVAVSAAGTTDADGDTLTYAWSFGDGTTATGIDATHAYPDAGPKTITLTVTDAGGRTATKTASVQVAAPPAPAPPPAMPQDQPVAQPPDGGTTPVPPANTDDPTAGDRVAPKLGVLRFAKGARLRITLSERAKVTVTLRRGGKGKAVRITRKLKAGTTRIALGKRRAGRYTVKVVAVDTAGNRSVTRSGRVRVR
ncbi:MAG: PKD domain-containing protein [Solirubrobacteraceae bacterium]|nr:PKD domain-containing protein [Solirubrobacteraceae bacterium]